MPRSDPQPVGVGQGADRRGLENQPLLGRFPNEAVGDPRHLLAAEDADQRIDLGAFVQQRLLLPLGEAAGDDHARASGRAA